MYEKKVWTVFEDPAGLDGADLIETSRRFVRWAWSGDGSREWEQEQKPDGSPHAIGYTPSQPRYWFYLHVDEESLQSVMDEDKARKWHGNCVKVGRPDVVLQVPSRMEGEDGNEEEEEEDEYDMQEKRKLVKIDEIVDL